jgi:hypothetical protein
MDYDPARYKEAFVSLHIPVRIPLAIPILSSRTRTADAKIRSSPVPRLSDSF